MITLKLSEYSKLAHVVAATEKSGVHTKFIPDYSNVIPTSPYTEDLLGLPVINIRHVPLMEGTNKFIKRTMDIIGSLLCIVLFSPIMLICVIGVKLSSKGPVIFCQERVGLHNRPFKMYKFRSMTVQTDEEEKGQWTTKGDARVTGIGRIMRATSMDELPQLFNVLKGDMSLIGPRPERPFFVEQFKEEIPRYMVKHQVRPGMTGWAQVNGYRGDTSIEKRIEYDLYYIENWTVGLDIKILFMTVFKGFVNENAY
jgi:Undecaprenyl-phosphate glucose phosphotransferase